jgi:hypothetical protein
MAVMPMITLPPGYDGTGLALLLESEALQGTFVSSRSNSRPNTCPVDMIYRAARMAQERNYTGYNIDWENMPENATSKVPFRFLEC